ncbi:hypothetical protein CXG81DRAFT_20803 [Caulochytrium protostelioides]|uniref:Uncharacterized protein n=1 Tax=Caulochytrium protostelioides TaxID=1555241 RepID=A0A4P9X2P9_9FUNG|nr:hypothetical protein CXG81DRAFT_20803 [Caulochytrium protostelioides]|eukprot:RKO99060.1 hypothetical protein CXG81DRAFT_20803 [Caulochytrium protostelioides]
MTGDRRSRRAATDVAPIRPPAVPPASRRDVVRSGGDSSSDRAVSLDDRSPHVVKGDPVLVVTIEDAATDHADDPGRDPRGVCSSRAVGGAAPSTIPGVATAAAAAAAAVDAVPRATGVPIVLLSLRFTDVEPLAGRAGSGLAPLRS